VSFIIPARRRNNRLVVAVFLAAAVAQAADLRGVWMAENNADASLERAHVIVDPSNGKIPYRPEALAKQKQNFENRATADPQTKCFQPGVGGGGGGEGEC
jgi:hypothetical protein